MLSRIELEVLATIERGDTVSEFATKLGHSRSYLSRAVADLRENGHVYTERDGRRKWIIPSDARAVDVYQALVRQHAHIEFPELLTRKPFELLYYSDQPRTVAEIADRSNNYRNTVNCVLKRFRDRGLVGTNGECYEFNGDFDQLYEFVREFTHHLHRQRLEAIAPKGAILWESDDEFLAQTETVIDVDSFHETGLARFEAFDLQFLLTDHRYYIYSEALDSVSPAELCCHTLLIDDGPRYRSYCLLFLCHVDVDEADLREQPTTYEIEGVMHVLLQYLETHAEIKTDHLPKWSEFQKLAADYEVSLPQWGLHSDETIESEYQQIAAGLTDPLTVYLLGGGTMALRDGRVLTNDS